VADTLKPGSNQVKNQILRTARRGNAEMQIDLRKARRWFDAEGQQPPTPTPGGAGNTPGDNNNGDFIPRGRFNEVVEKLRALEAAEEARKQKKALEEGQFQDVIKQLEPKAKRADELEKVIGEMVATEIEAVPEKFRGLIPELEPAAKLAWIRRAQREGLFGGQTPPPPPAPNLDQGGGGDRPDTAKLTPGELAMCAELGIKPEDYIKHKK
jgi:hypothetical protein